MKTKKNKRGFLDGYKTYDPSLEGYGSVNSWRGQWEQRMGHGEAVLVLDTDEPLALLGLQTSAYSLAELKSAYRAKVKELQACFRLEATLEDQERAKKIIAAYTVLLEKFN